MKPQVLTYYNVAPGNYNYVEIQFLDQLYRPLQIKDASQTVINLLLEQSADRTTY